VIKGRMEVWPEIRNKDAVDNLVSSVLAYIRKRNEEDLTLLYETPFKKMAFEIDTVLKPKVSFYAMVNSVHQTAKLITGDIAYLFRRILEPEDYSESNEEDQWKEELEHALYMDEQWKDICEKLKTRKDWADYDEDDEAIDLEEEEILKWNAQDRMITALEPTEVTISREPEVIEDDMMGEQMIALDEEEEENFDDMDFGDFEEDSKPLSFLDQEESSAASMLQYRSPIIELQEAYGRYPDLGTWANMCGVPLESLNRCKKEDYQKIFEEGKRLLLTSGKSEIMKEASYDIE
jgi:hypothetical protein